MQSHKVGTKRLNLIRDCSLHLLSLMMFYEISDITFFLRSLSSPSPTFNIFQYVSFASFSTCSFGHKLQHHYVIISQHFYFSSLPLLHNSLPDLNLRLLILCQSKTRLQQFFQTYTPAPAQFTLNVPVTDVSCQPNRYINFLVTSDTCWFTISITFFYIAYPAESQYVCVLYNQNLQSWPWYHWSLG